MTWENGSGSWKFYKDCHLKEKGTNFQENYTIKPDGQLILGRYAFALPKGSSPNPNDFRGMLSNVNVWDHKLPATQIKGMSQSCLLDEQNGGNVYKWADFLHQGGAKLVEPSPCEPFGILSK